MSDPSGAVSDEKTGVDALEEKAWMIKETVFPDTRKHPIPDKSCSRLEPLVQEELELPEVSPEDPELPEGRPREGRAGRRKIRKIRTDEPDSVVDGRRFERQGGLISRVETNARDRSVGINCSLLFEHIFPSYAWTLNIFWTFE